MVNTVIFEEKIFELEKQVKELIEENKKLKKRKRYGLVWEDEKYKEKVVEDCKTKLPILQRVKEKEIITNPDEPMNILIEGDNYHALSCLNYTHKGKIDVIYIDPPYNTGNKDFKYNDDYVDKEDCFRHSKWLNFMENRLALAKELLSNEGIIIISINDIEHSNLKLLANRIFGEENYIADLPTIMNLKGNNDNFGFSDTHEYTLVYAKNKSLCTINHFDIDEEEVLKEWKEDEFGLYKEADNLRATGTNAPREKRPNLYYPIFLNIEDGVIYTTDNDTPINQSHEIIFPISPEGQELSWYWKKDTLKKNHHNLIIKKTTNGWQFYRKQRPKLGDIPTKKAKTLLYKPEYSTSTATTQLKIMFGEKKFNNPKPVPLICDLIFLAGNKNAFILDFMAGSGTTGHAVLTLNKEDGGNRRFILCTNNENNICSEVCYPRIKKVINGYNKNGNGEFIEGLGGNLQYFRADENTFINVDDIKNISDDKKLELTYNAGELLALKEDVFDEKTKNEFWQVFENNKKIVGIYFKEDLSKLREFAQNFNPEKQMTAYIFSWGKTNITGLDLGNADIEVKDIPQPIISVYQQINKM